MLLNGLRKHLNRLVRRNKRLEDQSKDLVRLALHQRLRDGDFDWTDADFILNEYSPEYSNTEDYAQAFTVDAIQDWLARRKL